MNYENVIKQIRETLFLSQEALAKKLGVSFATVNRWETGKRTPSITAKRKIKELCEQNKITFKENN